MNKLKTALFASALSAGWVVLIFLTRDTAVSFRRAFETAFYLFVLGAIAASIYIWLADKWSILGRVARGANLTATLKALLIVIPLATVLSLAGIRLHALHDAQVRIFLAILSSCIISDAAHAYRRRVYGSQAD